MDDDHTNILICSTAKLEPDPFGLARVATRRRSPWHHSQNTFGLALMVDRFLLTAWSLGRLVGFQSAIETDFRALFTSGRIVMAEFEPKSNSHLLATEGMNGPRRGLRNGRRLSRLLGWIFPQARLHATEQNWHITPTSLTRGLGWQS